MYMCGGQHQTRLQSEVSVLQSKRLTNHTNKQIQYIIQILKIKKLKT